MYSEEVPTGCFATYIVYDKQNRVIKTGKTSQATEVAQKLAKEMWAGDIVRIEYMSHGLRQNKAAQEAQRNVEKYDPIYNTGIKKNYIKARIQED